MAKKAIIIGAGPAGLTAAYELLTRTDIEPVILEENDFVGGISATLDYKHNKIDMGGHRFFSKSERVMDWWLSILPLQGKPAKDDILLDREVELSSAADAPDPEKTDKVMLKTPPPFPYILPENVFQLSGQPEYGYDKRTGIMAYVQNRLLLS